MYTYSLGFTFVKLVNSVFFYCLLFIFKLDELTTQIYFLGLIFISCLHVCLCEREDQEGEAMAGM